MPAPGWLTDGPRPSRLVLLHSVDFALAVVAFAADAFAGFVAGFAAVARGLAASALAGRAFTAVAVVAFGSAPSTGRTRMRFLLRVACSKRTWPSVVAKTV